MSRRSSSKSPANVPEEVRRRLRSLVRAVKNNPEIFARIGVRIEGFIDAGMQGVVFQASAGRVAKVINPANREELEASLYFLQFGDTQPDGLPHVADVFSLHPSGRTYPMAYVILKEDIPQPVLIPRIELADVAFALKSAEEMTNATNPKKNTSLPANEYLYLASREFNAYRADVTSPAGRDFLRQVLTFVQWCLSHRVHLADVSRLEQWGRRYDGTYALRDFGAVEIPPSPQRAAAIKKLSGLR